MKRLLCIVLLPFLLIGCRAEPTVGEQVVVTGLGLTERNGVWTLSIQAVEALHTAGSLSEQSEPATAVYTASGRSVAEALQAFLNETGKRIYILQNQIILVEERTCRNTSLYAVLEYFIRNREGRALVKLAVSRGDPAALLGITTGSDAIPAEYLSQLVEEGHRYALCADAALLDAERALSGMYDAALPILEVQDKTPSLAGTALFREGKQAGSLTAQETVGLMLAAGDSPRYLYTQDGNAFRLEEIDSRITVHPAGGGWEYHVAVSAAADTVEAAGDEPLPISRVEETLEQRILASLKRTATEYDSDPLGLARRTAMRYKNNGVTQSAARVALPRAVFTVDVTLTHTDKGFLATP